MSREQSIGSIKRQKEDINRGWERLDRWEDVGLRQLRGSGYGGLNKCMRKSFLLFKINEA